MRARQSLAAAAIAAVLVPLGGARCAAEGPGGTPLPVHLWATWVRETPEHWRPVRTEHIIRPARGATLKGKTPLGKYVWWAPAGPLSNSGP